jgi:hypothetical protein
LVTRDFEITLRIPETTHIPTMFQVTQNDKDVYGLTVHITDGITEIDYSEVASATITFSKADGNVVQGDMAVGADSLTYTMGTNEIAHPGPVLASVQLFGAGGERLTSARFKFDVVKDLITPSAVQSTSEFPILQQLKQDLEAIDVVELTSEFNAHKADMATQLALKVNKIDIQDMRIKTFRVNASGNVTVTFSKPGFFLILINRSSTETRGIYFADTYTTTVDRWVINTLSAASDITITTGANTLNFANSSATLYADIMIVSFSGSIMT